MVSTATTYRLIRLAPGSYDLELEGVIVASVVRDGQHDHHAMRWYAEVLDETATLPAPFTKPVHEFERLEEVTAWLGHPDTVSVARAGDDSGHRAAGFS